MGVYLEMCQDPVSSWYGVRRVAHIEIVEKPARQTPWITAAHNRDLMETYLVPEEGLVDCSHPMGKTVHQTFLERGDLGL